MKDYTYIIIGGGMAAGAAVSGIREIDSTGSILMVSEENALPYKRPPLSKKLWMGGSKDDIYLKFDENDVDFMLKTCALSVNPELKRIVVSSGESFAYEKLLLATGSSARELPFGDGIIHYFRTIEDFNRLRELAQVKNDFAVIGAGFIGSEIAAALALNDKNVTVIENGLGIGWRIFPVGVVDFLNSYYEEKGVTVLQNAEILTVKRIGEKVSIKLNGLDSVDADSVIAGVGITLNTGLAEESRLVVQNGIHVNEILQTSDPSIFASGDVANFYNPLLARRIRVEHADNAIMMGKQAGRNMADANEPYTYLPIFYSDMFDLGYEAVGILDSRLKIIEDWKEKYQKGVLYYLEEGGNVVGVLLWNVWGQTDAARNVIGRGGVSSEHDLIGLIE